VKEYEISFLLGDVLHCFTAEAKNEYTAIKKTLKTVEPRKAYFKGFRIKEIRGGKNAG